MCSDRLKNHGCGQENQKALALPVLASEPLPIYAANSRDIPTEFAGGDQFSVPYAVPMMFKLFALIAFDFSIVTVMVYDFSVCKVFLLRSRA